MTANLLSLVLTYCQLCNSKNQTPKRTCQHFLLPTSIYLAFNRTSVPEADATRDKHSARPKFVRQQFKGALNPYTIHKLLCVRSRSSRACPHVSSPIACIKNCSGMHSTHLLVFNTWLHCQYREVAKRHPRVLQPGTVRFSPATYRSPLLIGRSAADTDYSIACAPYPQDFYWLVTCPRQSSNHSGHSFT